MRPLTTFLVSPYRTATCSIQMAYLLDGTTVALSPAFFGNSIQSRFCERQTRLIIQAQIEELLRKQFTFWNHQRGSLSAG